MCLIIHKPVAGIIPANILDNAETKNADGFGITYLDTMETFKTLDYDKARVMAENERPFVLHYRYATVGDVTAENCHPFPAKDGVLYSNGTVGDLGDKDKSDTAVVADMLHRTPKRYWKNMLSMTEVRFCIINAKGVVERHGEWHERGGIFYSKNNCFMFKPAPYNGGNFQGGYSGGYTYHPDEGWVKTGATYTKSAPIDNKHQPIGAPATTSPPVTKETSLIGFNASEGTIDKIEPRIYNEYEELRDNLTDEEVLILANAYNEGEMSYADYHKAVTNEGEYDGLSVTGEDDHCLSDSSSLWWDRDGVGDWDDLNILAVYGTLKSGFGNHTLLRGSEFLGEAESVEKLRMVCYNIPYLYDCESPDGHQIEVELYEVKDSLVKVDIDTLEGYPTHYKRVRKQFITPTGVQVEAWVFVANHMPQKGDKFKVRFTGRNG